METKNKKNGNIPNLRFKGFEGEWKNKKLGEIGEIITGSTPPTSNLSFYNGNFLFVSPFDIQFNRYIIQTNTTLTEKGFKIGRKVRKGSSLFVCIGSTIGKVGQAGVDCVTNQQINSVIPNDDNNGNFIYSLLEFNSSRIRRLSAEQAVPLINKTTFSNVKIQIPLLSEQCKIASFLSLIDERITTQMKTIESLESLMCGAREKIFSQKLRFKDKNGDEFPEWNSAYLSDVLVKNSLKNKDLKYSQVQSVSNKLGFVNQENIFENRRVASLDTSNYYVIEKGVFTYNPSRIDVGSLAYKSDDEVSVISPLYISFRANKNYLVDNYLLNWFSSRDFIFQMNNSFEGSVRNTLSYDNLSKMIISTPSLPEQQKIADFLSIINRKIETEKAVLTQYQNQKKFLLQNLFI